nr:elongation factor Ts [Candidatus Paceibacterota bacterium]
NPGFVARAEVPESVIEKAKELFQKEVADKPAEMQEKILEGKISAYFREQILLEQPFIKNPDTTIGEMVNGAIQKFGENVQIVKISRVSVK